METETNGDDMNSLKAVFWDYPKFTDPAHLRDVIQKNTDQKIRLWILKRFLEYGRVVDTWDYFSMAEIAKHLPDLNLSTYAHKKWKRMIEVYGEPERK